MIDRFSALRKGVDAGADDLFVSWEAATVAEFVFRYKFFLASKLAVQTGA